MLVGSPTGQITLSASADASFIRGDDSKGQLAYNLFLSIDSAPVLSKSQRDKNVAISSFHAEINALVEVTKSVMWARELLRELGHQQRDPTRVFQDNTALLDAVDKLGGDARTRYLINKLNFIREQIQDGVIQPEYLNTNLHPSDGGTKSQARIQLDFYRESELHGRQAAYELWDIYLRTLQTEPSGQQATEQDDDQSAGACRRFDVNENTE
jgi:hypothetical protein